MQTRQADIPWLQRAGLVYGLLTLVALSGSLLLARAYDLHETAVATVAALPMSYLSWLTFRQNAAQAERRPAGDAVDRAAEDLARDRWDQWDEEARNRKVLPSPIRVPWAWTSRPVKDSMDSVLRDDAFPPLPGVPAAEAGALRRGEVAGGLYSVYAGLRSGRVVLLGGAGDGKSDAALLTAWEALKRRRALDAGAGARVPVPVLLSAREWNPAEEEIADWVADRLRADFRWLNARTARELVNSGRIALFLDGFDEMDAPLRRAAIARLNRRLPFRLLLFSRTEEFADAVTRERLHGAAVLELAPVETEDAVRFLTEYAADPVPEAWRRLMTDLRRRPAGPLAQALGSPLLLTLVRDTYAGGTDEVAELLTREFADRAAVEAFLLRRFLEIAYPADPSGPTARSSGGPGYHQADVRRWLGYLAHRLSEGRREGLDWRRMHWWAPAWPRVLAIGVIGMLAGVLVGAVTYGPAGDYATFGRSGARFGALYTGALGLTFGTAVGALSESRGPRPRRPARPGGPGRTLVSTGNPGVGAVVGLGVAITAGNMTDHLYGAAAGLVAGLTAVFDSARERPARRSRWSLPPARLALASGCTTGLPVGVAYWLGNGLAAGLEAGLFSACAAALIVGAARPSARPEPRTDPPTSWSLDLRQAAVFGLLTGLCVGLPHGIANGLDSGLQTGLVGSAGHILLAGLAGTAGMSDNWRTTLLFLQLHARRELRFPVRGMRFLRDAHRQRVLRADGPRYEFRHGRLREALAGEYRDGAR
ncbi:hypothetical protein [Streptomyces hoynatensis]|uniref:NACHT domain-containing protein n=1 Tax=Streptomyces hoynatensis TaxID=1141874 RepID=A0A3A9YUT2_9ACTN|nr:hypothetical protein [Streptomyces hoynatensis]RKN38987.1 hypothetical protein D7294_22630 [Streptomyces hoynatensis]